MTSTPRQKEWYRENLVRERKKRREHAREYRKTHTLVTLYRGARDRAKTRGIVFTIKISDLIVPLVCPILKTPFIRQTQHAMSIDRIDPLLGYVPGNVQIISCKANVMKNNATTEELQRFAEWVLKTYQH